MSAPFQRPDHGDELSSTMSGTARDVVQARDISGGVHFHGPERVEAPPPRQLPGALPGFIGRGAELRRLHTWLGANRRGPGIRIAAIMGTAGAGKTSFAIQVAHEVRAQFPDGQLFINLRGYAPEPPMSAESVLDRFLRALGVPASDIPRELEERAELYRSLTAERHIIVVLDNAATVGQVRPLLPGGTDSLVLVTSRSRLAGLSAGVGALRIPLGLLTTVEAETMLHSAISDYRSDDASEHIAELAGLCARLPLALRIAAERAAARPFMPLQELIADLRNESSLWDALSVEDDGEADAVHSVFAWSYRALPPEAARTFRLLGMHPGPDFGPEAAAALTAGTTKRLRGLLDMLAGAHLVEQIGPDRFQFHDLLRAFAVGQAGTDETTDEQRAARYRLVQWYLYTTDRAVRATQSLFPSILGEETADIQPLEFADYAEAMNWYLTERSNLPAIARLAARMGFDDISWQLSVTAEALFAAHSDNDTWAEVASLGLAAAERLGNRTAEAAVRLTLGGALKMTGHYAKAAEQHQRAFEVFSELGDRSGMLKAANRLAVDNMMRREFAQALAGFDTTITMAEADGLPRWHAIALGNVADAYTDMGSPERAVEPAEQALELHRRTHAEPRWHIEALTLLVRIHTALGDLRRAEELMATCVGLFEAGVQYSSLERDALIARAELRHEQGDYYAALDDYERCILLQRTIADPGESTIFDGLGHTLHALGRNEEAVPFQRRAAELHRARHEQFELAATLSQLADSLDAENDRETARAARNEALDLLQPFSDPRAQKLSRRLQEILSARTPPSEPAARP